MSITTISVSPENSALAADHISRVLRPSGPGEQSIRALSGQGLSEERPHRLALPHPRYRIRIENEGPTIEGPISTGYLYFEGDLPRGVASFDTFEVFGEFQTTPQSAEEILAALKLASESSELEDADYEFRMLTAPALPSSAVWLHGPVDWVVVLRPEAPPFAGSGLIPLERYLASLGRWAASRSFSDDIAREFPLAP